MDVELEFRLLGDVAILAGELETYDNVRRASVLAMAAGGTASRRRPTFT